MSEEFLENLPDMSPQAEKELSKIERRDARGLAYTNPNAFHRVGDERTDYTKDNFEDVLAEVATWFVKKDNRFHDVTNLQTKYSPHDIKQVVVQRVRETFPNFKLGQQGWKDFFKVLLDPPVNVLDPELTIPVWTGRRTSIPTSPHKVFFEGGMAVVNIWEEPRYRSGNGGLSTAAFDNFLSYVMPRETERETFLDWLAWCLQHEKSKPEWAVLLYSDKQGTGKSTLTKLMRELFGRENTGTTNGVSKLLGRFNKEILENKLIIVEEVEVKRGSPQANSLKSLITEDSTMVEAKGLPAYVEKLYSAFIMTTNHLPLWLEESDRRFFILNFDHDGYSNGGSDYEHFTKNIIGPLHELTQSDNGIKSIYDELMLRKVPESFGKTLDVRKQQTTIMTELQELTPDVALQVIEQELDNRGIVFVPVRNAASLINKFARREINSQNHLFTSLGWKKQKFSWNGGTQIYCWYKLVDENKPPKRGLIYTGRPMLTAGRKLELGWTTMEEQCDALDDLLSMQLRVEGGVLRRIENMMKQSHLVENIVNKLVEGGDVKRIGDIESGTKLAEEIATKLVKEIFTKLDE